MNHRAGFVLPAVLGIMVLFAALIGALTLLVRTGVDDARLAVDDLEVTALLRAGLELAGYQLVLLQAPAAGLDGQQVRLNAGTVTLAVLAESARIDLNGSEPQLLAGAWRAAGLKGLTPEAFANRVVDWRDADDDVTDPDGAESAAYADAGRKYRPTNGEFRTVDDLRWVLGVKVADVIALKRYLTVANPAGTIDLYDAPPEVLQAIPGLTPATVARMLKIRTKRNDETKEQLMSLVGEAQNLVTAEPPVAYRVTLDALSNRGARRKATAVITRDGTGRAGYRVIGWKTG